MNEKVYTLILSEEEKLSLLSAVKENKLWENRIKNLIQEDFFYFDPRPNEEKTWILPFATGSNAEIIENNLGCASSGFCSNCGIFLRDTLCFCLGGDCPKCGGFVKARTTTTKDGVYEVHYTNNLLPIKTVEIKNGKWI